MIATPSGDGTVRVEYTYSLLQTVRYLAERGISAHPVFWPGEALVQRARNELVRLAIEADVDDVLFIDSDQEWEPEWAYRLLAHQSDCVGAPIRKKTDAQELYNVRSESIDIPIDPTTGLWVVDGLGTGFLRLTNYALRALWATSDEYEDAGHQCRMVFDVKVIDGKFWGEDTIMCRKLKDAGIPIHLDPSFTVPHIGQKKYCGDFVKWHARYKAQFEKEPRIMDGAPG